MDTPYGFKLSQIANNVGDNSTLNITIFPSNFIFITSLYLDYITTF